MSPSLIFYSHYPNMLAVLHSDCSKATKNLTLKYNPFVLLLLILYRCPVTCSIPMGRNPPVLDWWTIPGPSTQ